MVLERHQKFARVALDLAREASYDVHYSLCALIVLKNRIRSIGYNQPKTHPMSIDTKMQQIHAEMDALIRCHDNVDITKAYMIVVRLRPSGNPGMAKPCVVCQSILKKVGLRHIFYTVASSDPDNPKLLELFL